MRLLLLSLIAVLTALSPLSALTSGVQAVPVNADELLNTESSTPLDADTPDPQQLQLATGTPTSTTASDIRLQEAKLTWTPTGMNDTQDSYDVVIAQSGEVNDVGMLTAEPALSGNNLLTAEFDVSTLNEGVYYWQVTSCAIAEACNPWSQVWMVNIDGTAPAQPIAAVTSGMYDKKVVITGSAEVGSKLTVVVQDRLCEAVVMDDGMWTCAFEDEFDYGVYEATVTSTDRAGNQSVLTLPFSVKELFVAPQITQEELPPVLEVVPIDETVESTVLRQPTSSLDVNMGEELAATRERPALIVPLSTDGGLVQSSENGWQVLGMPWFLWAGLGGMLSAGWLVSSGRLTRAYGA